jgi:hypothetical protein
LWLARLKKRKAVQIKSLIATPTLLHSRSPADIKRQL